MCVCVCGRDEVYNDLDVGSHIEKCQREWTTLPRCVCVFVRGEVYRPNNLDVGSHSEKCQWEWTMMLRGVLGVCVCVCGRGEV